MFPNPTDVDGYNQKEGNQSTGEIDSFGKHPKAVQTVRV
jgi:hypothetical protein